MDLRLINMSILSWIAKILFYRLYEWYMKKCSTHDMTQQSKYPYPNIDPHPPWSPTQALLQCHQHRSTWGAFARAPCLHPWWNGRNTKGKEYLGLNEEQKQKLKHIQANTLSTSCQFIFKTSNCSSIFESINQQIPRLQKLQNHQIGDAIMSTRNCPSSSR